MELAANFSSGGALYLGDKGVGAVRDGTGQVSAVNGGGEEGSGSNKVERASGRQIMDLSRVPLSLHGLARRNDLERVLIQIGGLKLKTDAVKRHLVGCELVLLA